MLLEELQNIALENEENQKDFLRNFLKEHLQYYDCIFYQGEKTFPQKLWDLIEEKIEKVNPSDLEYDLLPLIRDQIFVKQFSSNFKSLIKKEINFYKNLKSF